MTPNKSIFLDDFFQLYGKHLYPDEWNTNAIYFLNSKSPKLIGFDLSADEISSLMDQGEDLNKKAVNTAKNLEKHLIKHRAKVFFIDNQRTAYEYHGEILAYDFIDSKCIDEDRKSHLCKITLKPSSEFTDTKSIQLFDPNIAETLKKNNKAVLVSRAVLVHFDYFGVPANYKTLIAKIQDEYQAVYGGSVAKNLAYDAIAVMADYWNERPKN